MVFRALADLTVVSHFAFIAFVLLGGLLVYRWPAIAWLHVPVLVWALVIEASGWRCPLTVLEKWLRIKGGWGGYLGDFVHHWIILPLFDPGVVTPALRSLLGFVPLAVSAFGYWCALRHRAAAPTGTSRRASLNGEDQLPKARSTSASASRPSTHA